MKMTSKKAFILTCILYIVGASYYQTPDILKWPTPGIILTGIIEMCWGMWISYKTYKHHHTK